ncbi:MAG: argininosuccinate lyase [Candidatus Aureabacteria bacterium]|nr:argininosuccinate lyase [Candidatus Auribacterota bacterium]
MGKNMEKNKKKLWGGRFSKPTNSSVEHFTESLSVDIRLYKYDIKGSIAHAEMLAKTGIISRKDSARIIGGLKKIGADIEKCDFRFSVSDEDIHMAIERALTGKIGEAAKKLHTARSRNDQVALDMKMYLKDAAKQIISLIGVLQEKVAEKAYVYADTVFPGMTHMQLAMPVTFGHYLLSFIYMFERDKERMEGLFSRLDEMPLGSCALAGTSLPIDRDYVAKKLGFSKVSRNSMDAVADRDYIIEMLSAISLTGIHLSRLCEDMVFYSSSAVNIISLPEDFCTGSSMMPNKKNPDVAEIVRGKAGGMIGNLVSVLVTMKALPMTYNRDMQEDKKPLFDSIDTISSCLEIMAGLVRGIELNKKVLNELLGSNFGLLATDLAEYLVTKGVPFRDAHHIIGKMMLSEVASRNPLEITIEELRGFSDKFESDSLAVLDIKNSVANKKSQGGTAPVGVKKEIRKWLKKSG